MCYLILFAMIGSAIQATTAYWIVYTIACVCWVIKLICNIIEALD